MKEIGTVVGVDGDRISVSVKRSAACEKCGKCQHAHITFGDNSNLIVEAISTSAVKPGDLVELEITGQDYLRLSFLLYVLPLLGTGVGFALGWFLGRLSGTRLCGVAFLVSFPSGFPTYGSTTTTRRQLRPAVSCLLPDL